MPRRLLVAITFAAVALAIPGSRPVLAADVSTTTILLSPPSTVVVVDSVQYTVQVTPAPPWGSINVDASYDGGDTWVGAAFGSLTSSDGLATITENVHLPTGARLVRARYAADSPNGFASSVSESIQQTVFGVRHRPRISRSPGRNPRV